MGSRKRKPASESPDITYIVSAYNRPMMLPVALWSIAGQTSQRWECIVTDNADNPACAALHKRFVAHMNDFPEFRGKFRHVLTARKIEVSDCYWAAEYAIKHHAHGTWLCFPCDDTYLVPEFGTRMLMKAAEEDLDMVICGDIVLGPQGNGRVGYKHWKMEPGRASKTTFIVRRSKFPGFTGKLRMEGATMADWQLTRDIGRIGRVGVVQDQLMVVHN